MVRLDLIAGRIDLTWIPTAIENDNAIAPDQVYTDSTGHGRNDEEP